MPGKPLGERVATLEAYYSEVNTSLKEINTHLKEQNGEIGQLSRFKIQVQAILAFLGFVVSLTAGTLIALLAAQVL